VLPHRRLRLGPDRLARQLEAFLAGVHWLSLEELGQQPGLDSLLNLLTLPVRPEAEIPGATEQILQPRPDLLEPVVSILGKRFSYFTREEIMALINLPTDHLRHTRWAQEWIEEGRQEGEARGRAAEAAAMAIRQLNHRCGPLSAATTTRIQALPLQQLEDLTDALLDFAGADGLASWLAEHAV
jgi:predicted transposase YdaD